MAWIFFSPTTFGQKGASSRRSAPLLLLLLLLVFSIGPARATVHSLWNGVSWNVNLIGEGIENLSGGIRQGGVGNATAMGGLSLDTGRAGLWSGGHAVAEYLLIRNGNPENYVGDVQGVNAFTGLNRGVLYHFYYRQQISHAVVRVGLMSANDYFDVTGVACNFLNVSYGFTPTIGVNVPAASSYPFSSLGAMASYDTGGWTLMAGAFGGDAIHPLTAPLRRGDMLWFEVDRAGFIGDGRYVVKLGAWRNHQLAQYQSALGPDTSGSYSIGEYRWKRSGMDWAVFLEYGAAPAVANTVPWYLGAGMRLRHFWITRPADSVGLGVAHARLRGEPFAAETNIEAYYSAQLSPSIFLQPDIQYVVHPGGSYPNALVGSLCVDACFS